jgi:hypothetical protein
MPALGLPNPDSDWIHAPTNAKECDKKSHNRPAGVCAIDDSVI